MVKSIICPFHDDVNPSGVLYHNNFYCFSCGKFVWKDTFLKMFPQYREELVRTRTNRVVKVKDVVLRMATDAQIKYALFRLGEVELPENIYKLFW